MLSTMLRPKRPREAALDMNVDRPAKRGREGDMFGGMDRDSFMRARVHNKLHGKAINLSDADLSELGRAKFNDQFDMVDQMLERSPVKQEQHGDSQTSDLFGGMTRENFMRTKVHSRLHPQASGLDDQQLAALGALKFNLQFPALENGELGPVTGEVDVFGGIGRDAYMHQRIHRRLHDKAKLLSDEKLAEVGKLKFNDQFPALEADDDGPHVSSFNGQSGASLGGESRTDFMSRRIHRRLHAEMENLSDEQVAQIGQLSFNEQFPAVEKLLGGSRGHSSRSNAASSPELFAGLGRDGYVQQKVHRKLHPQLTSLSDQQVFDLGQMKFNDQFGAVENMSASGIFDAFGGRDAYMQQKVHRKLHVQAANLSSQDLYQLGQLKFNDQFGAVESMSAQHRGSSPRDSPRGAPAVDHRRSSRVDFGGISREQYIAQHVHRKLHAIAATLSDEDALDLGQLSFNSQFIFLNVDAQSAAAYSGAPSAPRRGSTSQSHARDSGPREMFGGLDREAFTQQRVHRKLHSYASSLSDSDLADFGKRKFNDQFLMLEQGAAPAQDALGGMSRDEFMQRRVHRRLHSKVADMSDSELLDLGNMKFNDQFKVFEDIDQMTVDSGAWAADTAASDIFGGMSREAYMDSRVHRRLHSQASRLSDHDVLELGRLKFNDQFQKVEEYTPEDTSTLFGSGGRQEFIQKRLHRRLMSQVESMSDTEVYELGKLSFNQQFTALGHDAPPQA